MKTAITALTAKCGVVVLSWLLSGAVLQAEPPAQEKAPAREVISEERLRLNAAGVPNLKAQLATQTKPLTSKAPAVQSTLWSRSIILTDGDYFTLIPVGSILHLPPEHRAHIVAQPTGEFTFWPNFLKKNAAWLEAKEVSLEMSRGDEKAAKALFLSVARHPRALVAVYKGGPITVLEPAPEQEVRTKP